MRQLGAAFPEASQEELERLGRASLQDFAKNLVDALRRDRGVWISREDAIRLRAACESEQPLLILMGHLGAWELTGAVLAELAAPFGAITADPHNEWVAAWLRGERAAAGVTTFDRVHERWGALKWLRRGGNLALLADHRSAAETVTAPWFGEAASTVVAPARLARRLGVTVLAVGIRRDDAGHRLLIGQQLGWGDDDSELSFSTRCNEALQELILQAPTEWTWFHRRLD